MKKIMFILIFLLVAATVCAEDSDWFVSSEVLDINVEINGEVDIKKTDSDYNIQYLVANLSFFPRDSYYQDVSSMNGQPSYTEEEDSILFRWNSPDLGTLDFQLNTKVRTQSYSPEIKTKIKFPLEEEVPENYKIYLESTEKINSEDEKIVKIASEIVSGEDDLFLAELELVGWLTANIEYSLDSITEKASKDALWVLENKRGVCDELTNLFIAMNRALGIPARYVSGFSYTNYNDLNDFSGHAWAEVYFPGYGWIPYDITYGEFGYTDATHILLAYNTDSDKSSINYQWKSHGVNIETKPLNITAEIEKRVAEVQDPILIRLTPIKSGVGIGSYNLIEAEIENIKNSYVATELSVSKSDGYTIQDNSNKVVALKPYEVKKLYWIVKVEEDLDRDYYYTLPISVKSSRNVQDKTEFKVQQGEIVYTLEEINNLIEVVDETKETLQNVELECKTNEEYYVYEDVEIQCSIHNVGNTFLEDLNLCVKDKCRQFNLGITQSKDFDFIFSNLRSGKKEFFIKLGSEDLSETKSVSFDVLDEPEIEIAEVVKPDQINYDNSFDIEFLLKKKSVSAPLSVEVLFSGSGLSQEWNVERMDKNNRYVISLKGSDLIEKDNEFHIKVNFLDKRDNKYETDESFSISLEDLTFWQKIRIFLNKIISFFS